MTDDQQRTSESLDPDELGDDPGGDPTFPPEHARGARDRGQNSHVTDSVFERSIREEPETPLDHLPGDVRSGEPDNPYLSAEEAAMHIDHVEQSDPHERD